MKLRQYFNEVTTSGSIGDSYDVPYATGKGKYKTKLHPRKRNMKNIPKDKDGNCLCKKED